MTKTITINWGPSVPNRKDTRSYARNYGELVFFEPEPFLPVLLLHLEKTELKKCYSVLEYYKNTFLIRVPFDLKFSFNKNESGTEVEIDRLNQEFFDENISMREGVPFMLSVPPSYLFYSDSDVLIESLPVTIIPSIKNIRHIPGTFNIGKWIRPVDSTFVVDDITKEVNLFRGDPLFLVRFIPKHAENVVLKRVDVTEQMEKVISNCVDFKKFVPKTPLDKIYKVAEPYLKHLGLGAHRKDK